MKWLILFRHYHPHHVGGTTTYVRRFARALASDGHQVEILTPSYDGSPETVVDQGVRVNYVDLGPGVLGPLRFSQRRQFDKFVRSYLTNNHFDIVNIHDGFTISNNVIEKAKQDGVKVLFTAHAVVAYECLFDLYKACFSNLTALKKIPALFAKAIITFCLERSQARRADKLVVMSQYVNNTVVKWFGNAVSSKIHISAIGVDESLGSNHLSRDEARKALGIETSEIVFFTVRRLEPRMGLDNLISSWSLLNGESFLYIAGKGSQRDRLQQMINRRGLGERVKLLGYVEDDVLSILYRAADCFVIPTEQLEGFGIVTIDALTYGLPVIGTPRGATPEILSKFNSRLITSGTSPDSLAETINYFIANYRRGTVSVRHPALQYYNWQAIINRLIFAIYE